MANTEIPDNTFNFQDAPGGEMSLDDIFNDVSSGSTPQQTPTQDPAPAPQPTDTFLSTATGTTYKTAADAIKGIEHKDALIADLRSKLSEQTGRDPIRNKEPEVVHDNYMANSKKYFEDIKAAKDEDSLLKVQAKLVNDVLAPYAPLLSSVAKSQALQKVVSEVPQFAEFQRSEDYQKTLESFPLIKQSIEIAERQPGMTEDLAQLYKMVHAVSAGQNISKIVESNKPAAQVTPTRPTVSSTPLPPSTQRVAPPTLNTSEGRKSIIQAFEEKHGDFAL